MSVDVCVTDVDAVLTARLTRPRNPCGLVVISRPVASLSRDRLPHSLAGPAPGAGGAAGAPAPVADLPRVEGPPVVGEVLAEALLDARFAVLHPLDPSPAGDAAAAELADRLIALTRWVHRNASTARLPVGYFATGVAAAGALRAAATLDGAVAAVVSSQGRPDLAGGRVGEVTAATLLIVGGADPVAVERHQGVEPLLRCPRGLEIVPGVTHRLGEAGAAQRVVDLAVDWFRRYLIDPG